MTRRLWWLRDYMQVKAHHNQWCARILLCEGSDQERLLDEPQRRSRTSVDVLRGDQSLRGVDRCPYRHVVENGDRDELV